MNKKKYFSFALGNVKQKTAVNFNMKVLLQQYLGHYVMAAVC